MSELTLEKIEELLTEGTVSVWSRYQEKFYDTDTNWYFWAWETADQPVAIEGLGAVTTVEQFGGEGQGDRAWVVVKVEFSDGTVRYFKKDGYHASHDGTYYDGYFSEVTPQQKVVTVYE